MQSGQKDQATGRSFKCWTRMEKECSHESSFQKSGTGEKSSSLLGDLHQHAVRPNRMVYHEKDLLTGWKTWWCRMEKGCKRTISFQMAGPIEQSVKTDYKLAW